MFSSIYLRCSHMKESCGLHFQTGFIICIFPYSALASKYTSSPQVSEVLARLV